MKQQIIEAFQEWNKSEAFSGVFSVSDKAGTIVKQPCGYRNKAEKLPNNYDTAFGIASGTKFFTALAVCKLIDEGRLSLEDKIGKVLSYDLGKISIDITIRQLLTHTSGVGDYIDEGSPTCIDDMMQLYNTYPVYLWNNLSYYLQMSTQLPQKFSPGERFGYSNTGFVLLGLIVERITNISFQQYIADAIIKPCNLKHTNFYRMDRMPANTASGYCYDEATQAWYTNIFCIPAIGGADGGIYTCAADLNRLWRKLMNCELFSQSMLEQFLEVHVTINEQMNKYYSLGMYQYRKDEKTVYYAVGSDFGVGFFTAYFPQNGYVVSALGNTEYNTSKLLTKIISIV